MLGVDVRPQEVGVGHAGLGGPLLPRAGQDPEVGVPLGVVQLDLDSQVSQVQVSEQDIAAGFYLCASKRHRERLLRCELDLTTHRHRRGMYGLLDGFPVVLILNRCRQVQLLNLDRYRMNQIRYH